MNGRATRCRYKRRDENMCQNEAVTPEGESPVLCGKHMFRAHQLFMELSRQAAAHNERKTA